MAHHNWFPTGYAAQWAVRLFFVLSGFLITGILLQSRQSPAKLPALARFYARRALRIFPLYYAVIAAAALLDLPDARAKLPWLLSYLINFDFAARDSFGLNFAHFWTLCVEEQFYLLWPWLLFFLPPRLALAALPLAALAFRLLHLASPLTSGLGVYVLPFNALDYLGAGAILAFAHRRNAPVSTFLRLAAPAAFLLLALFFAARSHLPAGPLFLLRYPLEAIVLAGIVWFAVVRPTPLLTARPLLYTGKISYGLYILHPFCGDLAKWTAGPLPPPAHFLLSTVFSFLLASLSWFALEAPLNRLKRHFPSP